MSDGKTQVWVRGDLENAELDGVVTSNIDSSCQLLIERAEKSFQHAEYRLSNCQNEYDRIDCVLALKRSMQTRLEHLDSIYVFKQYPLARNHGWLRVLEEWGAIKQRTLRRMNRLRNAVEHDGANPPSLDDLEDYHEVVWWFLRGTVALLRPVKGYDFIWGDSWGSCRIEYAPLSVVVNRGKFDTRSISTSPIPDGIKLTAETRPSDSGLTYVSNATAEDFSSAFAFLRCAVDWARS